MILLEAAGYADKIVEWLAPHCDRIEIAGSIRRQRPNVNDVDLVVIPKRNTVNDLFGSMVEESLTLIQHLNDYVKTQPAKSPVGYRQPGGEISQQPIAQGPRDNIIIQLKSCQLDLFLTTEETIGSVLLCRTGSREHNIYVASKAREMGYQWKTMTGIWSDGKLIASRTEQEILSALKLDWIPPERRER